MMLKVYKRSESNFDHNGLAILNNAFDVEVCRELNASWTLSFSIPLNDPKIKFLQSKNIILCEGQQFRIVRKVSENSGSKIMRVECNHIFFADSAAKFLHMYPDNEILAGTEPYTILNKAFAGSGINLIPNPSLNGKKWITNVFDFYQLNRTNPLAILKKIMNHLKAGELYIDNKSFALVEAVGKDLNLPADTVLNLQSIKATEDASNIITRLYAYGPDGLPLPPKDAPHGYVQTNAKIQGENGEVSLTDVYGICEGVLQYDDIFIDPSSEKYTDAQDVLLNKALWEFDPENPERVDLPDVVYDVEMIELYKLYGDNFKFGVGDSIRIRDSVLGIDRVVKIVKHSYYPFEPKRGKITLGKPPRTLGEILAGHEYAANVVSRGTDFDDKVSNNGLGNGAVGESNIKTGAVSADKIEANAITAEKIKANAITAEKIEANAIKGKTITGCYIKGTEIEGGSIKSDTTIEVTTDLSVGENIFMGKHNDFNPRQIIMGAPVGIYTDTDGNLTLSVWGKIIFEPREGTYIRLSDGSLGDIPNMEWVRKWVSDNFVSKSS